MTLNTNITLMNTFTSPNALVLSNPFVDRFNEGGPFFMSLILICFLLSLFLLIQGFRYVSNNPEKSLKMQSLVRSSSLLGLVFGLFGTVVGLITAFDSIDASKNISSEMIAGGIKVALLTSLFGIVTFLLARIGLFIIKWIQK